MRRPDIELTDEAARFVERHPDVISRLAEQELVDAPAGQADNARTGQADNARGSRFRAYVRERRAAAGTPEAASAMQAFLARYSG